VAFARIGSKIMLVDAGGALMDLSTKKKYSFPVIVGMNSGEPLSTRSAQMKIYNQLVRELDSTGGHYSQDLSEVDLSDPEDVKVLTNDSGGEVLVHLGSSNYLDRFKIYVAHLREWRQQFQKLESVDLRYDRQIIVNPDLRGTANQPALSQTAAKAAITAGVKPAALVTRTTKKPGPHVWVRPAVMKRPEKASRWHKAGPKPSHVAASPAHAMTAAPAPRNHVVTTALAAREHTGTAATAVQPSAARQAEKKPSAQKPSPAILKGQDSR
jgi:cell division protein FtsQ